MREKLIELLETVVSPNELLCYGEVLVSTSRVADHLIANGVTFATDNDVGSKWIPVSERLPDEYDRYLCNIKSFAFPGAFYQRILQYDKYGFKEDHIYTDEVTHWMPLPEPPGVSE